MGDMGESSLSGHGGGCPGTISRQVVHICGHEHASARAETTHYYRPVSVRRARAKGRWRLVGRIAGGLAVMWTVGVLLGVAMGHTNPADPAKYAAGSAVVS